MSDERRITSEELALFAMQLLPKEEMAEVAAAVAQSEEARRELAEIQGDLAAYALTADMHTPPAVTRERLMKQVARERKAIPIDRPAMGEMRAAEQETRGRGGSVLSDSTAEPSASDSEAYYRSAREVGSREYLVEEEKAPRGVVGKVLPWIGWAVAAGLAVVTGNFTTSATICGVLRLRRRANWIM